MGIMQCIINFFKDCKCVPVIEVPICTPIYEAESSENSEYSEYSEDNYIYYDTYIYTDGNSEDN